MISFKLYILDEKNNVVETDDYISASYWKAKNFKRCRVAFDIINECSVSTVFTGFNQNYFPEATPRTFETLYDSPSMDEGRATYSTWEEALLGHKKICEEIKNENKSRIG